MDKLFFSFTHIEGITLGTGEVVDEVAGGMSVDRIGEGGMGLVKNRSLRCMGQILQWGLWPGMGYGGRRSRLVLTRS